MNLANRIVLVTGATGGLGQEFVRQSLARGAAKVYAGARRDHDWHDSRVAPLRLDVTDPASVAAAAAAAPDTDVLVNNAGVRGADSLLTSSEEEIRATYEANVFAPLWLVRAFAPALARNGASTGSGSAVIDVHSALSWLAQPGAYAASKTAFWGLTNALRLELADQKTQVVGAHLGYTDTPFIAHLDVQKEDPAVVVRNILDALEAGEDEAIADETSSQLKSILSAMTTGMLPQ
jgi:NAD(P)-dependent dehydrogenase (short-subunit alcohol dehydrogenase family)